VVNVNTATPNVEMSEMCLFCNFVVVVKFVDHESNIYTTKN
jgi:hypothetical protein